MRKPIILILIGCYLPGFRMGGPLRSIVNLVERLHPEYDFRILTSDRDMGEESPFPGVQPDSWLPVGPALVRYVSPSNLTIRAMARVIRSVDFDILYLNGFFEPRFTIIPLLVRKMRVIPRKPTIIATRGEFSKGALAIKSLKKRAYMFVAKRAGLFNSIVWQASSEAEAGDVQAALGTWARNVQIAMNVGSAEVGSFKAVSIARAPEESLAIVFVGRISPMKNLDFALRVLAEVRVPVSFSIYGPMEDGAYASTCRKLQDALPPHVSVAWQGPVEAAHVAGIMAAHDLLFLPTRGENFGHVIAEALSAGTPVLISDATPWRGLHELGVGQDLPLDDPSAFAQAIECAAGMTPEEVLAQRATCTAFMRERARGGADVEAHRQLFATAMKQDMANA